MLAQFDGVLAVAAPEPAGRARGKGVVRRGHQPPGLRLRRPTYGTKGRWSTPKLIKAANEQVLGANVRASEHRPRHTDAPDLALVAVEGIVSARAGSRLDDQGV